MTDDCGLWILTVAILFGMHFMSDKVISKGKFSKDLANSKRYTRKSGSIAKIFKEESMFLA